MSQIPEFDPGLAESTRAARLWCAGTAASIRGLCVGLTIFVVAFQLLPMLQKQFDESGLALPAITKSVLSLARVTSTEPWYTVAAVLIIVGIDASLFYSLDRSGRRILRELWNGFGFVLFASALTLCTYAVVIPLIKVQESTNRTTGVEPEVPLARQFAALLTNTDKPANNVQRLAFAQIAYDQKRFITASRLWGEALTIDPKIGNDRQAQHRYNAACSAALAAAGLGTESDKLDDTAKAKLRGQALDWLKVELTTWDQFLVSAPQNRAVLVRNLRHWQKDTDLASIRDTDQMSKLPADEQQAFTQLWDDVADLVSKAEGKPQPAKANPVVKPAEKKLELAPPPKKK
jgi:hypothetical protein